MRSALVVLSLLFFCGACAVGRGGAVTLPLTPLCSVVADPAAFEGREIAIRGVYVSDYHHGSLFVDPGCRKGAAPWHDDRVVLGEENLDRELCSEAGGLVAVTIRGRVDSRPGEVPFMRFHVAEYSDVAPHAYDRSAWGGDFLVASEATTSWRDRRRRLCFIAGYLDGDTFERRDPASR
jgi:hypothetical protein